MSLLYIDDGGILITVCADQTMVDLANQLSTHGVVDIYVATSKVRHGKNMLGVLVSTTNGGVEKDGQNVNDIESDSDSSKDHEERLANVPFIDYNLDKDENIEKSREMHWEAKLLVVGKVQAMKVSTLTYHILR